MTKYMFIYTFIYLFTHNGRCLKGLSMIRNPPPRINTNLVNGLYLVLRILKFKGLSCNTSHDPWTRVGRCFSFNMDMLLMLSAI